MMHLVLHVGAQGTDGGQIAAWLAKNRAALEPQGLALPAPGVFLRRISTALDQGRAEDPFRREEALLRDLGASGQRLRMVVSAPGLLGSSADVLALEGFYQRDLRRRLHALGTLFPRTRLSLLLATGPARQVIPALLPDTPGAAEALLAAIPEDRLPWARLARSIRNQLPQANLIAWRHENLSRVWPQVFRALVGPGVVLPLAGLIDFAARDLGAEATLRLRRYLTANPPKGVRQLCDVAGIFGRTFGLAVSGEGAVALPGWLPERLAGLDRGYETEWAELAAIRGVTVLPGSGEDSAETLAGAGNPTR